MDWTKFNTHGQSFNDAFEVMCNVLFEGWCKSEYKDTLKYFSFVNGKGGDGGVEAYYNVPLVKTQMKKIIVTAKTLYSHPKNVSKIYAALHTDLAW